MECRRSDRGAPVALQDLEGNNHVCDDHETGPVKGQCWTDLRERRIVGVLRLLDIEGNDPACDVRHTDLVKRADRNGVRHNHKAICHRVNGLQATRGRSIISSPAGSNWRRPGVFIRGATTFYKSPLDSSDLLDRQAEGVTGIQIPVCLKVDTT